MHSGVKLSLQKTSGKKKQVEMMIGDNIITREYNRGLEVVFLSKWGVPWYFSPIRSNISVQPLSELKLSHQQALSNQESWRNGTGLKSKYY